MFNATFNAFGPVGWTARNGFDPSEFIDALVYDEDFEAAALTDPGTLELTEEFD